MARSVSGPSHQPSYGDANAANEFPKGEQPPSTLAAQIVRHHERTAQPKQDGQMATFGYLLKEILNNPTFEETDLEVNYKLVRVVVEAGLDVFLQDDPFTRKSVMVDQAKHSILVIRSTIHRNPALLLFPNEGRNEGSDQQLFLWILPRVLVLLGNPKADDIQHDLQHLLCSLISSLMGASHLWQNALSYLDIYKSCADDLIFSLQQLSRREKTFSFAVDLPNPSIQFGLSSPLQQSIAQRPIPQCQVSEPEHACRLFLILVEICMDISRSGIGVSSTQNLGRAMEDWVVQVCSGFWKTHSLWHLWCGSKQGAQNLAVSYLVPLRSAIQMNPCGLAVSLLIQSISDLLCELPTMEEYLALQREVAKDILALWELSLTIQMIKQLSTDLLTPVLVKVQADQARFERALAELKLAVQLWLPRCSSSRQNLETDVESMVNTIEDGEFQAIFERLGLGHTTLKNDRPAKRAKLLHTSSSILPDRYTELKNKIWRTFENIGLNDTAFVKANTAARFLNLPEPDQYKLLSALTEFPCTAMLHFEAPHDTFARSSSCSLCDGPLLQVTTDHGMKEGTQRSTEIMAFERYNEQIMSFFGALTESLEFQKTTKLRIHALLAIRRFLLHNSFSGNLDLKFSDLGQFCLRSLRSSIRELRMVAGSTLSAILGNEISTECQHANRVLALDYLRQLSARDDVSTLQTTILAWGQVAQVCGDEELNLILLQLVEFLGHTNPLICGLAFNELGRLSRALDCYPEELMKPFSRSISISVVKDLLVRPQKAQQLADLLSVGVNQYLLATESTTLPYLVLAKRRDILARLAAAHGPGTTVQDVCMQPRANLISILSRLLLEPASDIETAVMQSLCGVAPGFADYDLASLIKLDSILIVCEMLKAAGDADTSEKPQIYRAIQQTAALLETKNFRSAAKQSRAILTFFDQHILGIMAHFSDVIENGRMNYPMTEKKRCLRAIEEVMSISKGRIGIALPQVRACLQSALDTPALQDLAFSAWTAMVMKVDGEDVCTVIDHTFAIIAHKWTAFSETTMKQAHDTVSFLIKNHESRIRESVDTIPSLADIPIFSKIDGEIKRFKSSIDLDKQYRAFAMRCRDENGIMVAQTLKELELFLEANSQFIHDCACSEQPHPVVAELVRSVLDACVAFKEDHREVSAIGARCLGLVGCIDPNRIDSIREKRDILILSNLDRASEVIQFVALLLESVLVKAFRSATNARTQGFLAYVMQELLRFCGFYSALTTKSRNSDEDPSVMGWQKMSNSVRTTLTPFLNSRYLLTSNMVQDGNQSYPIFRQNITYSMWLRTFASDLLRNGKGDNAKTIFLALARVIHGHDIAIPAFLLPFAVLNIVIGGTDRETENIQKELLTVLSRPLHSATQSEAETIRQCSVIVFEILDYMSRWMQEKKKTAVQVQNIAQRSKITPPEEDAMQETFQISSVERILSYVPAAVIATRAMDCQSYARAVYYWEIHMRQEDEKCTALDLKYTQPNLYERLQEMYAHIDEPDAVEGLSAVLDFVKPEQQLMQHVRSERWDAVQTWYELQCNKDPDDVYAQIQLSRSLYESGQNNALLDLINRVYAQDEMCHPELLAYGTEASWMTGRWQDLEKYLKMAIHSQPKSKGTEFDIAIGKIMLCLYRRNWKEAENAIALTREQITMGLSASETGSIQSCHDQLRNLHVLYELQIISGLPETKNEDRRAIREKLDRRLPVLGAFTHDKQDLLRLRRKAMELSRLPFTNLDRASTLTESARIARKAGKTGVAYNAIMCAQDLQDDSALIEHARMLWKDGQHRSAVKLLEGAIQLDAFRPLDSELDADTMTETNSREQNLLAARVQLLWAKWLDASGQTQSQAIIEKYQAAIRSFPRWEKGHYYLGKHYNKLLESEKALPSTKQSTAFLCGETAKLVIDNYLRSIAFGNKYIYQTLPRVITLWLEVASDVHHSARSSDLTSRDQRQKVLDLIHRQVKKYSDRLPAYPFYTALPQFVTRISHPHPEVWKLLQSILTKILSDHPQQAIWSIMAVVKSSDPERSTRGYSIINSLKSSKKAKAGKDGFQLRTLINHGQRLSDALLNACEVSVEPRVSHVSLSRNLGFSHSIAPCPLVVPVEATLTAALPTKMVPEGIKNHKAFPREAITIASFEDDVLVLSSLQRPRKLSVRGTDGRIYGLLCKPKDDLRKDQRLMEFNAMINRALKRDTEASKRRLYIKTYAVTPLNEECGAIEWVEGLKPTRDIMFQTYRNRGVKIDYNEIRQLLNSAIADDKESTLKEFWVERLVKHFSPVLHEWFVESFPEPEAWFAARLRYTRSCAVMSMVGHVLGLGDRHGENILLQQGNGGVFHVDFNCLFDKGLTFEKPELVPFRLTHNMVDAMGACGYEGPFRKSAELTVRILRASEDTLMTILETFLYDPTQDFIGKKSRKANIAGVPETPREVLDSVHAKLRGLMRGESVPLSVEGHVEALIQMAVDDRNLASMYIGWCAFW